MSPVVHNSQLKMFGSCDWMTFQKHNIQPAHGVCLNTNSTVFAKYKREDDYYNVIAGVQKTSYMATLQRLQSQ